MCNTSSNAGKEKNGLFYPKLTEKIIQLYIYANKEKRFILSLWKKLSVLAANFYFILVNAQMPITIIIKSNKATIPMSNHKD